MPTPEERAKGADGTCEVVVIETANGPVRINKSDFDEKKHKLYEEKKPEPQGVPPGENKPMGGPRIAEATGSSSGKAKG